MASPVDNDQSQIDKNYADGHGTFTAADVSNQEANPDKLNYVPDKDKTSKQKQSDKEQTFGAKIKKRVTITLLGLIVGGGALGSFLLTPAMGIVQMGQTYYAGVADQLAAMHARTDSVISAKLKDNSSGICGKIITVMCKFSSMRDKELNRYRSAGFTIDEMEDKAFGRKRITKMTAPDGRVINNPKELRKALSESAEVRSALRRVYNPKFYGTYDKVAQTVFEKNKTNKQKKISGKNDNERRESLARATAGEKASNTSVVATDEDGKSYVLDEDGKKVYKGDKGYDAIKDRQEATTGERLGRATVGGKATRGVLTAGLKGLSVLGAADTACTVYNTTRAVEATAKVLRSQQLIQFAMVILSTADSIKAGDATPEEVNFVGNMLTKTDMRETISDESSTVTSSTGTSVKLSQVKNPFYKKSAFDSPGYKVAAYNDAPVLTSRSQQYMVGGGLAGTLASVNKQIDTLIPGTRQDKKTVCKTVQNPFVRGVGLVGGIFTALGTAGWGTAISIGASVAMGFAMPFLESMLADIVAGRVIGPDIAGVDAGDAAFSGTGALMGQLAQHRGMQPLNKEGIKEYTAIAGKVGEDIAAVEAYDARNTPFDVYNRYSFLGSFAYSIYPSLLKTQVGATGVLASLGSLMSVGFSSVTNTALAKQEFNSERFSRCDDSGYKELGIDADIFCNVRYGLSTKELSMESDVVAQRMVTGGYITDTGTPKGDYEKFLEHCVNRSDGWGETSAEDGGDEQEGLKCVDGGKPYPDISLFRVYTMDSQILESMEGDD